MLRYLAVAALALVASPVAAQTVTFDEFTTSDSFQTTAFPFDSNGLHFSDPGLHGSSAALFWGSGSAFNADPGGATLTHNYSNSITVTRTGGGTFNLVSFDLADLFNYQFGSSGSVNVSFVDALGTSTDVFNLDTMAGLQTFNVNRDDLLSFTFGGPGATGTAQIDNIVYTTAAAPSVPEPATWAMMLLGLGAAGAFMRRSSSEKPLAA
jgi:hypothetical protein